MKQQQPTNSQQIANLFRDVSQDVSQLRNIVIHRLCTIEPSSICLKRIICPLCLHGRYRADDPGRGLPGISYFQTNALAAEKSVACAGYWMLEKKPGRSHWGVELENPNLLLSKRYLEPPCLTLYNLIE